MLFTKMRSDKVREGCRLLSGQYGPFTAGRVEVMGTTTLIQDVDNSRTFVVNSTSTWLVAEMQSA